MKANLLKKKIIFTIVMLLVYRFGSYLPLPAVDTTKLAELSKFTKSELLKASSFIFFLEKSKVISGYPNIRNALKKVLPVNFLETFLSSG